MDEELEYLNSMHESTTDFLCGPGHVISLYLAFLFPLQCFVCNLSALWTLSTCAAPNTTESQTHLGSRVSLLVHRNYHNLR